VRCARHGACGTARAARRARYASRRLSPLVVTARAVWLLEQLARKDETIWQLANQEAVRAESKLQAAEAPKPKPPRLGHRDRPDALGPIFPLREAGAMVTTPPKRRAPPKPKWNGSHGGLALPKANGPPAHLQPKLQPKAAQPKPTAAAAQQQQQQRAKALQQKAQAKEAKPPSQGTDTGGSEQECDALGGGAHGGVAAAKKKGPPPRKVSSVGATKSPPGKAGGGKPPLAKAVASESAEA
jgi:hypothetical protein